MPTSSHSPTGEANCERFQKVNTIYKGAVGGARTISFVPLQSRTRSLMAKLTVCSCACLGAHALYMAHRLATRASVCASRRHCGETKWNFSRDTMNARRGACEPDFRSTWERPICMEDLIEKCDDPGEGLSRGKTVTKKILQRRVSRSRDFQRLSCPREVAFSLLKCVRCNSSWEIWQFLQFSPLWFQPFLIFYFSSCTCKSNLL